MHIKKLIFSTGVSASMILIQLSYTNSIFILTGDVMIIVCNLNAYICTIVHCGNTMMHNIPDFMQRCATNHKLVSFANMFTPATYVAKLDDSTLLRHKKLLDNDIRVSQNTVTQYPGVCDLVVHIMDSAW
jgi:hypothetical protein